MFICKKYKGERAQTDSFNSTQRHVGKDTSKAVPTFQYFADVNGELGDCADATNAHITAVWKTSRQLLPIITNRVMSLRNWASIFSFCMAQCLLYGWEKWSEFNETILPLSFADNDMVLWICSAWLEQLIRTEELHERLGIIRALKKPDGVGFDTLASYREKIKTFGQEA